MASRGTFRPASALSLETEITMPTVPVEPDAKEPIATPANDTGGPSGNDGVPGAANDDPPNEKPADPPGELDDGSLVS